MQGECLCGAVRFELADRYQRIIQCHCSLCRKQGGGTSNAATFVRAEDFRWLAGRERISTWQKDTGFRSHFCQTCGSPVPNPLGRSTYVWVPTGLLSGTEPMRIVVHIYLDSKAGWDIVPDSGEHFEQMPPLAELIALLHGDAAS
jgi:hypothetical protein